MGEPVAVTVQKRAGTWEVLDESILDSEDVLFWKEVSGTDSPENLPVLFRGKTVELPVHVVADFPDTGFVKSSDLEPFLAEHA